MQSPSIASLLALSVISSSALAQSVVVPAANATARGTSGLNTLVRGTANPRTYMLGINASALAGIPAGSVITGVSFRPNVSTSNAASWPPVNTTWSNYEVTIGNAIPTATWTTTFASNFSGTPVLVRTGPLVLQAGAFTSNSALPAPQPNAWGEFYWDFQQNFTYIGGDLGILFSHTGSDQATHVFIDYVANNAAVHGVSYTATGFQVPTGAVSSFCIPRIHYGYGNGCPGTGGIVPVLVQTSNVTGGGSVSFAVGSAPANSNAIYVIGTQTLSAPLPGGCNLYTDPLFVFALPLSALGRTAFSVSFPAGLSLNANVQAIIVDLGVPSLITSTNGVSLTVTP